MFSIPRVNVIESDKGFSIEVLGRTGMRYYEGEKSLSLYSEVLARKGIAILARSIEKWDPPYEEELITAEKRLAIIANIKSALDFKQEPLEIL